MNEKLRIKIRLRRNFPSPAARRHLRERAGLTQADIAKAIGVDRASVARYELGQRKPAGEVLARYVALLDQIVRELQP